MERPTFSRRHTWEVKPSRGSLKRMESAEGLNAATETVQASQNAAMRLVQLLSSLLLYLVALISYRSLHFSQSPCLSSCSCCCLSSPQVHLASPFMDRGDHPRVQLGQGASLSWCAHQCALFVDQGQFYFFFSFFQASCLSSLTSATLTGNAPCLFRSASNKMFIVACSARSPT